MHRADERSSKIAETIDPNLINEATLLKMAIETMCDCGLFDEALDE